MSFNQIDRPIQSHPVVVFDANHPELQSGKRVYLGPSFAGEVLSIERIEVPDRVTKDKVPTKLITFHTYLDANDQGIFNGKSPDGQTVVFFVNEGSVLDKDLMYGKDGTGTTVGDIVQLNFLGKEKSKNGFWFNKIKPSIFRPDKSHLMKPVEQPAQPVQMSTGTPVPPAPATGAQLGAAPAATAAPAAPNKDLPF